MEETNILMTEIISRLDEIIIIMRDFVPLIGTGFISVLLMFGMFLFSLSKTQER